MEIKDVENLAQLARIEIREDEKKEILSEMEGILNYIKQIEKMEVEDDIKSSNESFNIWREDLRELREFSPELIVKQFPDSRDGFLKVKKIL